jgi:hypothetical protein
LESVPMMNTYLSNRFADLTGIKRNCITLNYRNLRLSLQHSAHAGKTCWLDESVG